MLKTYVNVIAKLERSPLTPIKLEKHTKQEVQQPFALKLRKHKMSAALIFRGSYKIWTALRYRNHIFAVFFIQIIPGLSLL
jgi:hypothetical protein